MKWVSTRGASPSVPFIDALFAGTAPDGGLYFPDRFEPLPPATVASLRGATLVEIGTIVGSHLLKGEITPEQLRPLIADALDFPIPLVQVSERVHALELFHGPTMAFKDVGARVQARLLHHFTDGTPLTILAATSGDTGSAVAQAFHGVPDTRVFVLYPQGQVSDVQEAQMASLGDNITAVSVRGTFDDCQSLVKRAFADDDLRRHVWLTPANSINLGRLLPQVFYYFVLATLPRPPIVAVPSGNFGNLTAGMIAHRLGLPIDRFVAATNVNDAVPVFLKTGHYEPRESIRTVANAMDVGAPSNFERITSLYGNDLDALRRDLTGVAYTDEQIVRAIGDVHARHGYLLDPHGAVGWLAINDALTTAPPDAIGVFLATAHPAKFLETVEPATGTTVPLPSALADAVARPRHSIPMDADYAALSRLLRS
jgi:threonine synthase